MQELTATVEFWRKFRKNQPGVIAEEKKKATIATAAKLLLLASAASTLIGFAFGVVFDAKMLAAYQGHSLVVASFMLLLGLILATIVYFSAITIYEATCYAIAKALGGTGSFKEHYFVTGLIDAPAILLYALSGLPVIGAAIPIGIIGGLAFPKARALKEIHGFGDAKAWIVLFAPAILIFALLTLTIISIIVLQGATKPA